ncbi:hypothetical protein COX24_03800 [bacterium (Candidatus Gribaldobacteria) CG23_combo_of_CG06-09_8_20_14_all_37_87_8]|uniref:Uncharacterized protein n=1 Tax=bacterium (Candidatus Gribaldobacteria) CG23_combo_of_CG06-09_8_20_14_all_37_87_8 TaxID=2014278 RepID=A0A2G9ZFP6_9BACT|nr:MAG: hypothetical protein COX24_03800 [bacterium (Candidatus Gribaldobacteria) CG23_combo_of_CG06-09_8_20_14_all_37_87_8]
MSKQNKNKTIIRKKNIFKSILKGFLIFLFLTLFLPALLFLYFIKDLPRPEKFDEGLIPQSTKIYDRTGEMLLYEIAGEEKRTVIKLSALPDYLPKALIATEDKSFYIHSGFDLKGIARALLYDLKLQKITQGASTISQQLIRSYFLTQNRTLKRKTRELLLTLELERRYSKEQIMEWYLNLIPLGGNLYGVETASQQFFNQPAASLSLAQAATLVALIQSPTRLSPYGQNIDDLLKRKDFVLDNMVKIDFLTKEECGIAKKEKLVFQEKENTFKAPHFVMFVKDYLETKYTKEYLQRAGLKVITTLDYSLQVKAERVIKEGVEASKYANTNNGALIALNPKTGELLAMVGSKDYFAQSLPLGCVSGKDCLFDPQVNTTLSLRQPGSAFKPFVYSLALSEGFTPQTYLWDAFTEFNYNCSGNGLQSKDRYNQDCYHPHNYDGLFIGQITLKNALAQSRNVPAVKVLYLAGLKNALEWVKKFGISTLKGEENYGLALVLGGGEVKLLEMTLGYSVFANDGVKSSLNFIQEIQDGDGRILEKMQVKRVKIMPQEIARQINDMLSDNVARAPMFGWNSPLFLGDNIQAAVKTGTTQEYKDAWTIGYTPTLVVGTWAGNNNNTSMTRASASIAAPLWKNFILQALDQIKTEPFIAPQKTYTGKSVLDGSFLGNHSLLYYLNKDNPTGSGTSQADSQFANWEAGVQNWLSWY